jgi:uncharacterized iron-regulated membrane protein
LKARTVRLWSLVHTWTSLISTAFLLLLCLTGLPLIFHHELDELIGTAAEPAPVPPGTPTAPLDRIAAAALAHAPGEAIQYISWEKDEPGIVYAFTNSTPDGDPNAAIVTTFDAHAATALGPAVSGPMQFLLRLHVDMFAGLPGKLFLGFMGLLFIAAIVSGVVLYWPFTRRLTFGTIRSGHARRVIWLDLHNLLGILTIVWAVVVGATGVINTLADPMVNAWRATELAAMVAPYAERKPPVRLASLDVLIPNARAAAPGMSPSFIAFPGTPFSSPHHYAIFMRGDDPLTSRLLRPVLLDGETGAVADTRALPWYLTVLLVSQPLHFGDYGGMPLKVIWALLDTVTIVVLGSGLYLWWVRRYKIRRMRASAPDVRSSRMPPTTKVHG